MVQKVVKYLSSLRFTLLLICLLGVMFLAGLWIPQKSLVTPEQLLQWKAKAPLVVRTLETLQFTTIYTSPIMLALWFLFFLNLSLVMWQRIPLIKKRIALTPPKQDDPETAPGYPFRASYQLPSRGDAEAVIGFLGKRRFAVLRNGERFFAVKNRLSPLAFAIFHVSFFFILLGGVISVYSKFVGMVDLAEGETFQGELARYNAPPLLPKLGAPPTECIKVDKITPLVSGNTPTGLKVRLLDGGGAPHEIDINKPYDVGSTSFVIKDMGVAPVFEVTDPAGKTVDGACVRLTVMKGKGDSFALGGFVFRTHFYPDYLLKDGVPDTRSQEFKNPVFTLLVERNGKQIARGEIGPNGSLSFDGYHLLLREMPFWVRFMVIKEYGLAILYAGFAMASLAVIWRFLFFRRELIGALREEGGGGAPGGRRPVRILQESCRGRVQRPLRRGDGDRRRPGRSACLSLSSKRRMGGEASPCRLQSTGE
jgi:hypothetical protein